MDYPNMRRMMERDRDTDSPLPVECAALLARAERAEAECARLREALESLLVGDHGRRAKDSEAAWVKAARAALAGMGPI